MKIFILTFFPACLLSAQVQTLEPFVVEANKTPTITQPTLEEARRELESIPGGTETIDAERYLTGRASTFADMFFLSPGVVAQPRFGSDEARVSVRGSGLQRTFHGRGIRLMQDGIPLNLADGGFDMQTVDALSTSHVNIWRGGNALTRGSTTLGGAFDYLSHTGYSASGYSLRLEAGSWEYVRARIAGGMTEGKKDFYYSLSHASQDGFREHAEQSAQRFFSNFGIRFRDDLETRFYLSAIHTDSELPGSLTKAEMHEDPRQADRSAFGALNYDNRRDYELFRLANKTTLRDGANTWNLFTAWTHKELDHPITPFAGVLDQISNDLVVGADFTHESMIAERENQFRAGVTFTHGKTAAASYLNVRGKRGVLRTRDDQTATNLEAFIENKHHLTQKLSLTTAVAAAHSTRKNTRVYSNPTATIPFYSPPAPGALTSYDDSSPTSRQTSESSLSAMPSSGSRGFPAASSRPRFPKWLRPTLPARRRPRTRWR
jgi:iron complex outermembrane recepter protein